MATPSEVFSTELVKTICDNSLTPREELGQNFLVDWETVTDEVSYADVDGRDTVLEIGPGLGILTCPLADRAGRIVAIEKDDRFRPMLNRLGDAYGNVDVTYEDALDADLGAFDFDKVVANLPYGVSLPLLFELLETDFETAILLVQADLADRLTKSPGDSGYNRLSVQFFRRANVQTIRTVDRESFYPPPDVDGTILRIDEVRPKFEVPSEAFFKNVLMFFFAQRERTVRESLLALSGTDGPVNLSTTDLTELERDHDGFLDQRVASVRSRDFGLLARFLWDRFGEDADAAIERYYDEHDLYKRARGE